MRRYSHPNMRPGQRKYRALSPLEQAVEDARLLAYAKLARERAVQSPDTNPDELAQLDAIITRLGAAIAALEQS